MTTPRRSRYVIPVLAAAMHAYDATHRLHACPSCGATWFGDEDGCEWCGNHRRAQAAFVLKPPAPRHYGYATDDDLAALGIDPAAERTRDLHVWAQDLEMAVEAGLVTEQEARAAWASPKS